MMSSFLGVVESLMAGQGNGLDDVSRRALLKGACGVGFVAALMALPGRPQAQSSVPLRPPGALPEPDFLAACVRCGLCARACQPWDILMLAGRGDGLALGTPFFIAREKPCEMCVVPVPCIEACPTGALQPLKSINDAKMGTAVLVDQENCLCFLGLRCEVCYRACPRIDAALLLVRSHNPKTGRHTFFIPTVVAEHCTGCGKCEDSCVLPEAAIKVLPLNLARGKLGAHYRRPGANVEPGIENHLLDNLIDLPDRVPDPPPLPEQLPGGGYRGFTP